MSTTTNGEGTITTLSSSSTTTPTTLIARSSNPHSGGNSSTNTRTTTDIDPQGKRRTIMSSSSSSSSSILHKLQHIILHQWKGNIDFVKAQCQVVVVLLIAYIGNNWKYTYPRNDNQNYTLFWGMNLFIVLVGLYTMQHIPNTRLNSIQILSRSQTEEWKGWMQWAFIMYHYYRATNVYNVIRVFVSSYVWMTGFGNFLYFDKKQDFSIERAVSMWLRINYFPILLSIFVGVPFDLLYIVPLHTTAFFITMMTCYVGKLCETYFKMNHAWKNCTALTVCVIVHLIFYETPMVELLNYLFGHEIYFRFNSDKYSAVLGIVSGYVWHHAQSFVTWAHTPIPIQGNTSSGEGSTTGNMPLPTSEATSENSTTKISDIGPTNNGDNNNNNNNNNKVLQFTVEQTVARYGQRIVGLVMILVWWFLFGYLSDKLVYNPIHPFVFWLPVFGWLMIRNSSKYLTEVHSTALEFFGKITLETYVLQFHVFMCRNVQHIPIVIPGSGPNGNPMIKFLNMVLTGIGFVALAYWARKITVTTQTTVTDLVVLLLDPNHHHHRGSNVEITTSTSTTMSMIEKQPLTGSTTTNGDEESNMNNNNGDHLK